MLLAALTGCGGKLSRQMAVLRRFVEIVIDPATVTGWVKNDSGQRLCYRGGEALAGQRQIGGVSYNFDKNGIMSTYKKVLTSTSL